MSEFELEYTKLLSAKDASTRINAADKLSTGLQKKKAAADILQTTIPRKLRDLLLDEDAEVQKAALKAYAAICRTAPRADFRPVLMQHGVHYLLQQLMFEAESEDIRNLASSIISNLRVRKGEPEDSVGIIYRGPDYYLQYWKGMRQVLVPALDGVFGQADFQVAALRARVQARGGPQPLTADAIKAGLERLKAEHGGDKPLSDYEIYDAAVQELPTQPARHGVAYHVSYVVVLGLITALFAYLFRLVWPDASESLPEYLLKQVWGPLR